MELGPKRWTLAILVAALTLMACSEAQSNQPRGAPGRALMEPQEDAIDPQIVDSAGVSQPRVATDDTASTTSVGDGAEEPPEALAEKTDLDLVIDDLVRFVEAERGHAFPDPPVVVAMRDESFFAAFRAMTNRDSERFREDFVNYTEIYRAMGIIDGERSLAEIWDSFGEEGVLAFYDVSEQRITVRNSEITVLTRTVLVHELVHALDDQLFGLDRPSYDSRDDEIAWTFDALQEGNAAVIEDRYRNTLSQDDIDDEVAEILAGRPTSQPSLTSSFIELHFGRYSDGEVFAERLWEEGTGAVDAAFENPPAVSELLLSPEAYLQGDSPDIPLTPPPADGTVFESGVWGQAAWAAILGDVLDRGAAVDASDGWGGDWFVAWRSGSAACVRADIAADSPDALDGYAEALEMWAAEGDREVFYPTADLVRITACA